MSHETIRSAINLLVQEEIVYRMKWSETYFYKEKLPLATYLMKISLVLQGQNTGANSDLITGIRSILSNGSVGLHIYLTDNKFSNEARLSSIKILPDLL